MSLRSTLLRKSSPDTAPTDASSHLDRRQLMKLGVFGGLLSAVGGLLPQRAHAADVSGVGVAATSDDWSAISPFLRGNHAPVREERTDLTLEIEGHLPPELAGTFLRNGPNPQFKPLKRYHWFDGDGMVHAVQLKDGKASYLNRYIHTRAFELERKTGRALYQSITEPPFMCKAPRGEPRNKNTANTALLHHGGKLLALWEGGEPYELNLPGLETVGAYNFRGGLKHAFTAHPKVDPITGELLTFGYRIDRAPYVYYSVFGPDHSLRHHVPIEIPRPVMMHDFAITEHYSIFLDLPEIFDLWRAVRGKSPLVFMPELGARLGVMPRYGKTSELKWFEIDPCYVFHVVGAWEEGQELVLVGCRYPRFPEFLDGESSGQAARATFSSFYEWRLNLLSGKVSERALDDQPSEFPQVNPRLVGRQARYTYSVGSNSGCLVKFDLQTQRRQEVTPVGRSSEPMFVAHPDPRSEDHGWVVSLCYNDDTQKSELLVLDAASFDPEPVARVRLPVRVPFGFHAAWVPDAQTA